MILSDPLTIEVWGDLACFTRPELKVERMSYPMITPSAARGIFDAIFWKPGMRWQIERIDVLRIPRFVPLRRNEVKSIVPERTVRSWMRGGQPEPLIVDDDRTQRQTMALKDVRYRLHGRIRCSSGRPGDLAAKVAQFRRRAGRGQCHHQPCFGCREFPAYFELLDGEQPPPPAFDLPIGWMLYDVFDADAPGDAFTPPTVQIFEARIEAGVLRVPPPGSPEIRRPQGRP
jgi:CRISPR-associated protein Cas5d